MKLRHPALLLPFLGLAIACQSDGFSDDTTAAVVPASDLVIRAGKPVADLPGERHLRNVRQLTFGGENAEAYWAFDGTKLILQSKRPPFECDQIFVIDLATGDETLVSTGKGRTTCSYFLQGDRGIVYSSTHLGSESCPSTESFVRGRYVWQIYPSYDVFRAAPDGSNLVRLTDTPGYDAEATVCPVTGLIVFTSVRDGDLEVYTMEPDGSDVRRLTNRIGYDGGPFFSPDGSKIVLRSGFPADAAEEEEYLAFLRDNLVVPNALEITLMNRDGSGFRRVTNNGAANFAPYFHPDNEHILFASNQNDPNGRNFEIFKIHESGRDQEQITFNESFDGFPMFSPDGRFLVFASNRYASVRGETNVFVAEWVE